MYEELNHSPLIIRIELFTFKKLPFTCKILPFIILHIPEDYIINLNLGGCVDIDSDI